MISAESASKEVVTRFAPSPTGFLHLGHAYAALFAHNLARQTGGRFLVRIEDIDQSRAREAFVAAIFEDLAWLGLKWEEPVRRQSDYFDNYRAALDRIRNLGLLYPCFCTRRAIATESAASAAAPHGPLGLLYPGTCRALSTDEREARMSAGESYVLRLDTTNARNFAGASLSFLETGTGPDGESGLIVAAPERLGDFVLARKDVPASYHLCVTLDDALQGVTCVTRGADLFHATHAHRLLQALLGLGVPAYRHHKLLSDSTGRRFAKRDKDQTLRELRKAGVSPADIRRRIGLP